MSDYSANAPALATAKQPQLPAQIDHLTMEVNKLHEIANMVLNHLNNSGLMRLADDAKAKQPEPAPMLVPLAKAIYDNTQTIRSVSTMLQDIQIYLEA